jgi:hypothetical protein
MLIFIDQSGYPVPKDQHPFSVLLAVCLEESQSRRISGALHSIKQTYLDIPTIKQIYGRMHEIGLESNSIIKPLKTAIDANDPTLLEIKGSYLAAQKVYEEIPKVHEFLDRVLKLLENVHAILAIVMPRPTKTPTSEHGHLGIQYRNVLEAIQTHMEVTRAKEQDFAVVIFDESDRHTDTGLVRSCCNFIFQSYEPHLIKNKRVLRLIETPLFVDSSLSSGLQLADFFAYIGRQYFTNGLGKPRRNADPYLNWIKSNWEYIKNKAPNHPDKELPAPGMRYGIRVMKADDFEETIRPAKIKSIK